MDIEKIEELLKDIEPRLLQSEQFQRLIESLKEQSLALGAEISEGKTKRTLTPYVDSPSILECAWK